MTSRRNILKTLVAAPFAGLFAASQTQPFEANTVESNAIESKPIIELEQLINNDGKLAEEHFRKKMIQELSCPQYPTDQKFTAHPTDQKFTSRNCWGLLGCQTGKDLNQHLQEPGLYGIVGPTASGKTAAACSIANESLNPDVGDVVYFDFDGTNLRWLNHDAYYHAGILTYSMRQSDGNFFNVMNSIQSVALKASEKRGRKYVVTYILDGLRHENRGLVVDALRFFVDQHACRVIVTESLGRPYYQNYIPQLCDWMPTPVFSRYGKYKKFDKVVSLYKTTVVPEEFSKTQFAYFMFNPLRKT